MQYQHAVTTIAGNVISGASRLDLDLARSVLIAAGVAVTFVNINAGHAQTLQADLESRLSDQVEYLVAELEPYRDRFETSIGRP